MSLTQFQEREPLKNCNDAKACIDYWAAKYGVDPAWLHRIAQCESGYNLTAHNPSGATGLFQFMPSTFAAWYPRAGAGGDIYSADDQARTAAYMFSVGQSHQWECH